MRGKARRVLRQRLRFIVERTLILKNIRDRGEGARNGKENARSKDSGKSGLESRVVLLRSLLSPPAHTTTLSSGSVFVNYPDSNLTTVTLDENGPVCLVCVIYVVDDDDEKQTRDCTKA